MIQSKNPFVIPFYLRPAAYRRAFPVLLLAACCALSTPQALAEENPDIVKMSQFVDLMQGFYATIEAVHEIASSPEKSAILEMQKIQDIYKDRGDQAEAIKVLQGVLKRTDNPTVRNAAAIMLGDALNETGRASEAVKVLQAALEENIR